MKKECYGILEKVFPMGEGGLREVPPGCFNCDERKECLKTALETREGLALRSDILHRAPAGGLAGLLRRWSEKKSLSRRMKQKEKGR